jgi:ABC-type transport system involved in cytochrome bd biosynthesis fused ATPase/permease subunit
MKFNLAVWLNLLFILVFLGISQWMGWFWAAMFLLGISIVQIIVGWQQLKYVYKYGGDKGEVAGKGIAHLIKVLQGKEEPTLWQEQQRKKEEFERTKKEYEEIQKKVLEGKK